MAPPMYFRDEADEGEESVEENESGSEEEGEMGPTGVPMTNRSRKAIKICRHFSYALIYNAIDMGWEEQEVANLIKLVANQLNFDEAKLIRCLEKTSTGSPGTIACLLENSEYSFSAAQLVSVILSNARNVDHFITLMGEAFECSLFDLAQPETIDTLYSFVGNNMDYRESQRYARQLCEHSSSKKLCGRVLHKFTSGLTSSEAAAYMYDIITLDFFQDIRGSTKDLMKEIPRAQKQLEALLNASHNLDKDGEIIDSDADSEGNLRDFVVNSDSDDGSGNNDDESGSGSGSDGESDSDGDRRRRHSHDSGSGSNSSNSSNSDASASDSDRDADLSEEENSRYKPTKAAAKKPANGAKVVVTSAAGKRKDSRPKSKSKLSKSQSFTTHVESEEEDWGSDSSRRSKSSTGSAKSSDSEGSGSHSSTSSHSLPAAKSTKGTANNAIKATSQALKRKRIQDDSSDEESVTEKKVSVAKKVKTESNSIASASASGSSKGKVSNGVVKTEKRIVLSESGSSSDIGSDSDGDSSQEERINANNSARAGNNSSSSSGSSDSASSQDSDSDSSGSDRTPSPVKKGSVVSSAPSAKNSVAKIKVEPGATQASKVKTELINKKEAVVVKKEVVIKKEKEAKKEKESKKSK